MYRCHRPSKSVSDGSAGYQRGRAEYAGAIEARVPALADRKSCRQWRSNFWFDEGVDFGYCKQTENGCSRFSVRSSSKVYKTEMRTIVLRIGGS